MLECPLAPLCDFTARTTGEIDEHVATCDLAVSVLDERNAILALGRTRGDI